MIEPGLSSSELDAFLGTAPRARWRRWLLWLSIAAGISLLALLATRFANGGQAASYISTPVVMGDLPVSLTVTGRLEPSATSVAGTAVVGVVAEVLARKDDVVRKGQVLARLETAPFRSAVDTARQDLSDRIEALAQAQDAEAGSKSRLRLFQDVRRRSGGLAPSDREMRQANAAVAAASDAVATAATAVQSARSAVADKMAALAASEIRAPIDGVVIQSNARAGQKLGPAGAGALLFVIAAPSLFLDIGPLAAPEAVAGLPENAAARVTVAGLPGQVFTGRLAPRSKARPDRRWLRVDSSGTPLRPGMTAEARLDLGVHPDVLLVPNAALQFAQASDERSGKAREQAVYVLSGDGTPRRQPVSARASDGQRTEIAPGTLDPGMRVILGLR